MDTLQKFVRLVTYSENELPISSFQKLTPGAQVLARWSDNKFYNATIDYVGFCDQKPGHKKGCKEGHEKKLCFCCNIL